MGSEKFCLRWNDFESNVSSSFSEMRKEKDFLDVTLACEEEQVTAHKLVLSACSSFFRSVLRRYPHQNPLLYLKGVRFIDLQAILTFMYHGEVNVAQEDLNSFLSVAEELRVKGLTQNPSSVADPPASAAPATKVQCPLPAREERERRCSSVREYAGGRARQAEPETRSRLPVVKTEPPQPDEVREKEDYQSEGRGREAPSGMMTPYQSEYDEYGEEEGGFCEQQYSQALSVTNNDIGKGGLTAEDLAQYVVNDNINKEYHCALCDTFKAKLPSKVKNHLEAIHFPGLFLYTCDICEKTLKGRNALNIHKSTMHPKKTKPLSNI